MFISDLSYIYLAKPKSGAPVTLFPSPSLQLKLWQNSLALAVEEFLQGDLVTGPGRGKGR